jgi:glycosyltransferase involved in cell wall biosynthesis
VRERIRWVARSSSLVVVAPIPWFPFNRWTRRTGGIRCPFIEIQDGIQVYHPPVLSPPLVGKSLDAILYAMSLVPFLLWLRRRFPFDLVDAHFTYPDGVAAILLGHWFRRPTLVTLRGTHDLRHAGFLLRRWQIRHALRAATRLIAVSESLRQFVASLGIARERVRVIANGVDRDRFVPTDRKEARDRLGLPHDRIILLAVGNLVEVKGHQRVIDSLPDLVAKRPELLFIAIGAEVKGDGYRQSLDELVCRSGLEKHVRIVSPRPHEEIPIWMAAADLFCLATRSEGCCNAIREALACGLPVVTTRVGGNPEMVHDGGNGLLVPFWDGRTFVDAIDHALTRDWDRRAIAAAARDHGWERTADQVLEEFSLARATPTAMR